MSKKEFLQLPPLLKEFGLEEVSMIWLFTKMSEGDKKKNLAFLYDILTDNPADNSVDLEHIDRNSVEEADELTRKFSDCMGKLIARIMRDSCNLAAYAYLQHCVNELTADEFPIKSEKDREHIRMLMEYYDKYDRWEIVVDSL